ncbi:MAG: hypothetical protein IKO93_04970 [Lentisphaeria bacterium]|nr:hypothetical protein [Lentisphaeria bacterium]
MKRTISALLLLAAGAVLAQDTNTEKFFGGGPTDADIKLPADKVYPMGRLFPFSFYSTGGGSENKRGELLPPEQKEKDMKAIFGAGASLIGPQYELNDQVIADAKKYHVGAIMSVRGICNGEKITKQFFKTKTPLDAKKLTEETAPVIRELAKNPEIAYWDVKPEERRFWKKREVLYLQTMYEIIKANDPLKRPVFMYEPGHLGADSLAKLLPYQDLSAKGTYTSYSGFKEQRVWVRYSIEQETKAIKTAALGRPIVPFMLPEMFRNVPENEYPQIEIWVRHDIYCAIANGARGVMVFSARRRPNFPAWQKYLDAYLKVCRELSKRSELSQAILFGKVTSDLEVTLTSGPQKIPLKRNKIDTEYPPLSVAQFLWNGARYLLVVNSANQPVKAMADNLVYGSGITVKNLLSQKNEPEFTAPEGNFEISLAPYEAACYKIFNRK